ncbi:MAG: ImmA/IrrE family metallo-endopeptidase [Alphaproteobacteria bacterium]|jgi:Zn-dependent peptidase ImmA (M78 family)|nr:ImmA/IrrE family metallo-endopeptidase [Alphaproteobacteria bacterium]
MGNMLSLILNDSIETVLSKKDKTIYYIYKQMYAEQNPIDIERFCWDIDLEVEYTDLVDTQSGYIDNNVIYVNRSHPKTRQRFTIAHELGHFILHPANERMDRKQVYSYIDKTQWKKEREANAFAAMLLMPKARILELYNENKEKILADEYNFTKRLKDEFNVSIETLSYRLRNLGLVN